MTVRSFNNAQICSLSTHRYLLNDLVKLDHIKKLVLKRFTKFYETINSSDIPQVRILHSIQSKDVRSTYCRNINHTLQVADVRSMSAVNFSSISINPVPPGLEWRVPLLRDLLHDRQWGSDILTKDEINIIITEICVNWIDFFFCCYNLNFIIFILFSLNKLFYCHFTL